MRCPKCGETRISWEKKGWGAGAPQFWEKKKELMFVCGGKYIYDEETNVYESKNPCGRKENRFGEGENGL